MKSRSAAKRRWIWPEAHTQVVAEILRKVDGGTRVIFVPGNHDEAVRQFIGLDFGGIKIRDEHVHTTAKGKRMLVLHGDRFDGVIACAKWLAHAGDWAYGMALSGNDILFRIRKALGNAARDMLLGPEPVPAGIKPILEVAIDHDFFTGRTVIPEGLKNVEAAEQYTATTSELGKQISAMMATKDSISMPP